METLTLRIEVDVKPGDRERYASGFTWTGEGDFEGVSITVLPSEGHGFGLSEVLDASLVFAGGVAAGVTANFLTDAIKSAIGGTIRRARALKGAARSPRPEEDEAFEIEATSVEGAVRAALEGPDDTVGS
jgi:hypothetical protein